MIVNNTSKGDSTDNVVTIVKQSPHPQMGIKNTSNILKYGFDESRLYFTEYFQNASM